MKKQFLLLITLLLAVILLLIAAYHSANRVPAAKLTLDVYGSNKIDLPFISRKYQTELTRIAANMLSQEGMPDATLTRDMATINRGIQSMGHFSYVGLSPIRYPNDPIIHITIDVVEKKDATRIPSFQTWPKASIPDPNGLIQQWLSYEAKGFSLLLNQQLPLSVKACPAYHCLFGFDHPALKPYGVIFNRDAEKNKAALARILKNDRDEKKRGAAVFLLAHITHANELISLLLPAIHDPSQPVRNNAMRVLAEIMRNRKSANIPLDEILPSLDLPTSTDRNKAMYMLLSWINQSHHTQSMIPLIKKPLLSELKLQQPNNHFLAYEILKKISGEHFSDRNYRAWENWLDHHASLVA